MSKSTISIKHIAKLSNLTITQDEEKVLDAQLDSTLKHVKNLGDINTQHIVGTNEITDLKNISRMDDIKPSLSQDEATKNAKKIYNGFFVVPVVIEEAIEE